MKYKTFRILVLVGGVAFAAGGLLFLGRACMSLSEPSRPEGPTVGPVQAPVQAQGGPQRGAPPQGGIAHAPAAGEGALRQMDQEILTRAQQNISGDKVKDAFPGRSYKVNLYKDAGRTAVNRAKIDLDRDDKWDEKWTFSREGGREEVKRQVSPADDDTTYSLEYRLRGGQWVKK